jgi:hypothetical protein
MQMIFSCRETTMIFPPTLVFFTNVPAIYRVARTYAVEINTNSLPTANAILVCHLFVRRVVGEEHTTTAEGEELKRKGSGKR